MVDPAALPGFLMAVVLISVVPGPDHAYIAAAALDRGVRAGLLSAVGMAIGMTVHVSAAVLGLAVLLESTPRALDVVRVAGAAYLGWLALTTLRSARRSGAANTAVPGRRLVLRAVVTNVANPKVILFFAAFLPQFVSPGFGPIPLQMMTLGGLFLLLGLVVDCLVGLSFGRIGSALALGGRISTALSVIAGLTFATLAALLLGGAVST